MNLFLGTLILTVVAVRIKANLPIVEGPRPLDCNDVDECEETPGRETKVCGTDGRTYKTLCGFMRAHCKDGHVDFKNYGECSASEKCLGERRAAERDAKTKKGVFIPSCEHDGTFKPVQCHKDTGYCWCSTPLGHAVRGTVTHNAVPDCLNLTKRIPDDSSTHRPPIWYKGGCQGSRRRSFNKKMLRSMMQEYKREKKNLVDSYTDLDLQTLALRWKFGALDVRRKNGYLRRAEYKGIQKIIRRNFKPRKCAKKFPKFCDVNGDKQISLDEWTKCFHSETNEAVDAYIEKPGRSRGRKNKKVVLGKGPVTKPRPCDYEQKQAIESGNPNAYVPKCDRRGKFRPVQCYGSNATNSWYCFCVDVATGKMIENTSMRYGTPNCSVSWPKCPPPDKEERFLKALLNLFVKYAKEKIYKKHELKAIIVNEKNVVETIFNFFDRNGNTFLERKEKQALRKIISKKNNNVWTCGRKLNRVCDSNSDNKISKQEFFTCVTPRKDRHTANDSMPRMSLPNEIRRLNGKTNPFIEIIKSE